MKQIPSFPAYEIDETGTVYRKGRPLKPCANNNGYMRVFLRRDGKTHTCYVQRLVCETFHGQPKEGEEARHVNGVRSDNRRENVIWGTKPENASDMERHGTRLWGEKMGHSRLTAAIVMGLRDAVTAGQSMQAAARSFGVDERAAAHAITGRKWARIPGAIAPFTTRRRLSDDDVREIRRLSGAVTQADLETRFVFSRGAVQQVIYGKSYRHVA